MLFLIHCVVICVIFTIVIMVPVYKNPMSMIASYPPKIRARVESLPQYKDTVKAKEKSHNVKGAVKGTIIGAVPSLLAALVVLGLNVAMRV